METEWMTAKEVAERWRCSLSTISRLVSQGKLRVFRVGTGPRGGLRIQRASVEEWERGQASPAAAPPPTKVPTAPACHGRLAAAPKRAVQGLQFVRVTPRHR